MIRLMVFYPNAPGARFGHKYYAEKHVPLFKDKMGTFELMDAEIDKRVSGGMPGSPVPFMTVFVARFKSPEEF